MNSVLDITDAQRGILRDLLDEYLSGITVWAYGSRVKGTARPASDLDLVVFASPDKWASVSALREAFEESNLPFRVDLFVWDDVPVEFQDEILADHIVIEDGK